MRRNNLQRVVKQINKGNLKSLNQLFASLYLLSILTEVCTFERINVNVAVSIMKCILKNHLATLLGWMQNFIGTADRKHRPFCFGTS